MDKINWEGFVTDLIILLKEDAQDFIRRAKLTEMEMGKKLAYYEVFTTIVNQSKAFGIDLAKIGLKDFDPDKTLL